jgi:hypothetical protein
LEADGILCSEDRRILFRARTFMEGFLHRSRLRFGRSPRRGWPKSLWAELDVMWLPRPSGASEAQGGEALESRWTAHREAVAGVWEKRIARG